MRLARIPILLLFCFISDDSMIESALNVRPIRGQRDRSSLCVGQLHIGTLTRCSIDQTHFGSNMCAPAALAAVVALGREGAMGMATPIDPSAIGTNLFHGAIHHAMIMEMREEGRLPSYSGFLNGVEALASFQMHQLLGEVRALLDEPLCCI